MLSTRRRYRRADGDGRHSDRNCRQHHGQSSVDCLGAEPRLRHACRVLESVVLGVAAVRALGLAFTSDSGARRPAAGPATARSSRRRSSPRGTRRRSRRSPPEVEVQRPAVDGRLEQRVDRAPDEFVRVVRVECDDSIASSLRVSRSIESRTRRRSRRTPLRYPPVDPRGSSTADDGREDTTYDSSGPYPETQVSTIITYDKLYHGLNITTGSGQLPKDSDQIMTGGGDETAASSQPDGLLERLHAVVRTGATRRRTRALANVVGLAADGSARSADTGTDVSDAATASKRRPRITPTVSSSGGRPPRRRRCRSAGGYDTGPSTASIVLTTPGDVRSLHYVDADTGAVVASTRPARGRSPWAVEHVWAPTARSYVPP